ncbi:MAG: tyrosine-protein kinase family protein [Desulfuromonadales bacterium]|nr:MAG: tyrosine-protein kinase family protein [Desulfuromonadales bacterium]
MSRIEEILEKATRLREKGPAPGTESSASAPLKVDLASRPLVSPDYGTYTVDNKIDVTNPYLVTVTQPQSQVTEEYKKLKSIIIKMTKGEQFLNTFMVTSTLGGEGKSITSLNIAMALAQEYDHTVVLVDCDLRRPSIHAYLDIPVGPGLSDCLVKGVDVGSALVKTGIGKLSVLPAGSRVQNPAELISSARMRDFITELKSRYSDRYVIIDTPPVLNFAEAHAIGSVVDGAIFVVREGYVPVQHLKDAVEMLKGVNILGVVYNNVEMTRYNSYRYYGSYGYKGYTADGAA